MSASVAVGVFDGVHLGHARILERAVARARAHGARCVVVSFDPHPDLVLAPRFEAMPPLTPLPERRERIAALGADALEVLPFTRELAQLSPEEFVDRFLVAVHRPVALVVGENFALGRGRAGNVTRLREIGTRRGFEVEAVPLVEMDGGTVNSTRIRALLAEGRVAEAARLLGRRYGLAGTVVRGDAIGRTLGYPTANLRLHEEKVVPADGIYAVWTRFQGEREWRAGAMSVGVRPTFGGQVRTLEVHVLDWNGELLGRELEIEFADWLRPERRFESPEALTLAIGEDVSEVRRRLGLGTPA
ncbi:MAG TPA: bifunctional riboflavin kinase/FAD synthetase [Candidatus Eisenbacteria bacterium]|jgi:riboflavin kinase/FMN adenylyltransferase